MKIFSIFQSINGEVNTHGIGSMCTFIRFAGCSAKCSWCDSEYAKDPSLGEDWSIATILKYLEMCGCKRVTITGGEPLEQQEDLFALLVRLREEGYFVSVETNGLIPFNRLSYEAMKANWVVDLKLDQNVDLVRIVKMKLQPHDFIKIVVGSEVEFRSAVEYKIALQQLRVSATFAFSPKFGLDINELLSWMKKAKQYDAHLNFQAHKVLNIVESP